MGYKLYFLVEFLIYLFLIMYKIVPLGQQLPYSDFPQAIYKYRNWADEMHNRILTHNEIYLASPAEFFSDYPECKLPEQFNLVTDEMLQKKILNDTEKEFPWMGIDDLKTLSQRRFGRHKFHDIKNRQEVISYYNSVQDDYLGIFSACLQKDNLEMWEKFADLSKGYCVALNPHSIYTEHNINGAFGRVDYYDESNPPVIIPISFTESETIEKQMIRNFSVPKRFEHENEYRIAKYNYIYSDGKFTKIKYNINSRRKVISAKCFLEIILGSDFPKNDIEEIITITKSKLPNCPIYQVIFEDKNSPLTFKILA